jgi:hypothetical protein
VTNQDVTDECAKRDGVPNDRDLHRGKRDPVRRRAD